MKRLYRVGSQVEVFYDGKWFTAIIQSYKKKAPLVQYVVDGSKEQLYLSEINTRIRPLEVQKNSRTTAINEKNKQSVSKAKRKKSKRKNSDDKSENHAPPKDNSSGLSEYELRRLARIEENRKVLVKLGVESARNAMGLSSKKSETKTSQPRKVSKKRQKRKIVGQESTVSIRRSKRQRGIKAVGIKDIDEKIIARTDAKDWEEQEKDRVKQSEIDVRFHHLISNLFFFMRNFVRKNNIFLKYRRFHHSISNLFFLKSFRNQFHINLKCNIIFHNKSSQTLES